jgi:hypothetical protein
MDFLVFVKNVVNSAKHVLTMINAYNVFKTTILLEENAMHSGIARQVLGSMAQLVSSVLPTVNHVSPHLFAHIANKDII